MVEVIEVALFIWAHMIIMPDHFSFLCHKIPAAVDMTQPSMFPDVQCRHRPAPSSYLEKVLWTQKLLLLFCHQFSLCFSYCWGKWTYGFTCQRWVRPSRLFTVHTSVMAWGGVSGPMVGVSSICVNAPLMQRNILDFWKDMCWHPDYIFVWEVCCCQTSFCMTSLTALCAL